MKIQLFWPQHVRENDDIWYIYFPKKNGWKVMFPVLDNPENPSKNINLFFGSSRLFLVV